MQNESDEERECNRKSRPIMRGETLETEGGEVFVGSDLKCPEKVVHTAEIGCNRPTDIIPDGRHGKKGRGDFTA